jgi:hypothetical protein
VNEGPPFKPNDFLQKAEMEPPCDPEGNPTMADGLMISSERVCEILEGSLHITLTWIMTEKQLYEQKVAVEVKELQDKSVEELDENLRKQWPRKGRLEVEIYQQRKSEITAHNKKYERHVRGQLEKYNGLEEEWTVIIESMTTEFKMFKSRHEKMKSGLPDGRNLAELQGMSRREKDANQIFEEKCIEFNDQMYDVGEAQPN